MTLRFSKKAYLKSFNTNGCKLNLCGIETALSFSRYSVVQLARLLLSASIGLKPIVRRIWAPKGERPGFSGALLHDALLERVALGHRRYEWLYVWGFVEPAS